MYQVAGGVDNISGIKVNLVEWRKKRKVSHSDKNIATVFSLAGFGYS